jgi:hypothetical protein
MKGYKRAYYRTLTNPRYKHKQGQTIIIPSTWIGPTTKMVGNKLYRVLPNLI